MPGEVDHTSVTVQSLMRWQRAGHQPLHSRQLQPNKIFYNNHLSNRTGPLCLTKDQKHGWLEHKVIIMIVKSVLWFSYSCRWYKTDWQMWRTFHFLNDFDSVAPSDSWRYETPSCSTMNCSGASSRLEHMVILLINIPIINKRNERVRVKISSRY